MQGTVLGTKDTPDRAYTVLVTNLEIIWGNRIPKRESRKCRVLKGHCPWVCLESTKNKELKCNKSAEWGTWMCIDYIPEITRGQTKQTGEQKALSCVYIQGWGGCYSCGIMRLFFFLKWNKWVLKSRKSANAAPKKSENNLVDLKKKKKTFRRCLHPGIHQMTHRSSVFFLTAKLESKAYLFSL